MAPFYKDDELFEQWAAFLHDFPEDDSESKLLPCSHHSLPPQDLLETTISGEDNLVSELLPRSQDTLASQDLLTNKSVDFLESEAANGGLVSRLDNDEGEGLDETSMKDIVTFTQNILVSRNDDETLIEKREKPQERDLMTFLAGRYHSEDVTDSIHFDSALHLLEDVKIMEEANVIASTICGKPLLRKMVEDGTPILPLLLSAVQPALHDLEEEGCTMTLAIFRSVATKWMYSFMRDREKNVAAHPPFIKAIPRKWLIEYENCYPSVEECQKMADTIGLKKDQLDSLFENERKRKFRNDSEFNAKLKSHFSPEITAKFRNWQSDNPGKQPDATSRQILMGQTGKTERQVKDWFNNHKPGRDRSKKKNIPT